MKEDNVYLDDGKIEYISDINDNGYAVFYDNDCFLGLINVSKDKPEIKILGHFSQYSINPFFEIDKDNRAHIILENADTTSGRKHVVFDFYGNVVYSSSDRIHLKDGEYYLCDGDTKIEFTNDDSSQVLLSRINELLGLYNSLNPNNGLSLVKK